MVSWQQSVGTSSVLPWLQISPFFWPLQLPKWTGFLSNAKYKNTDVCYTVFNRSAISIFARLLGLRTLIHEKDGGVAGPPEEGRGLGGAVQRHWCKMAAKKFYSSLYGKQTMLLVSLTSMPWFLLGFGAMCWLLSVSSCKAGNTALLLNGSTQDESEAQLILAAKIPLFSKIRTLLLALRLEKAQVVKC